MSKRKMVRLTDDQVDAHCDHIARYVSAQNAADGSNVDPNANVDQKNIATMKAEIHKSEDIQINRKLIQEELIKTFGTAVGGRLAKQYLRDIEDHIIYTHDESSLATIYCCAIDLFPLLERGTKSLGGHSGPPTHLSAYMGQLINTLFTVSSQVAGAVGIPGALVHMDAFARKDFGEDYMVTHLNDIKQSLEFFIYTINEPAGARGFQSVFSNVSILDKDYFEALFGNTYYPQMPDIKPNWSSYSKLQEYAIDLIRDENSRAVLTFPVKTATILHDGTTEKDPEFVDMIADDLSKGSQMFLYLSTSVDSLSSCCRLRNSLTEDDKEFSHSLGAGGVSTGSLNVITLNMNRIVQDNKNLKSIVDRVIKYQVAHRKLFERMRDLKMYPIYDAGFIDMNKQFLTTGVNGLVEAAESLGIPIRPGGEYQAFVEKVLQTLHDANKAAKKEFGYKFNTEFVPKSCGYVKFSLIDLEFLAAA